MTPEEERRRALERLQTGLSGRGANVEKMAHRAGASTQSVSDAASGGYIDPISGWFHRVFENAARRVLDSTRDRLTSQTAVAEAHSGYLDSLGRLHDASVDFEAKLIAGPARLAVQVANIGDHLAISRINNQQALTAARIAATEVDHKLLATNRNLDRKLALGDARMDAREAEAKAAKADIHAMLNGSGKSTHDAPPNDFDDQTLDRFKIHLREKIALGNGSAREVAILQALDRPDAK